MEPILVPQSVEHLRVLACLEERVLNLVVLMGMQTELRELFSRHGGAAAAFLLCLQLLSVLIGVGAENANLDLSG